MYFAWPVDFANISVFAFLEGVSFYLIFTFLSCTRILICYIKARTDSFGLYAILALKLFQTLVNYDFAFPTLAVVSGPAAPPVF